LLITSLVAELSVPTYPGEIAPYAIAVMVAPPSVERKKLNVDGAGFEPVIDTKYTLPPWIAPFGEGPMQIILPGVVLDVVNIVVQDDP
jgi:hypothetical protein